MTRMKMGDARLVTGDMCGPAPVMLFDTGLMAGRELKSRFVTMTHRREALLMARAPLGQPGLVRISRMMVVMAVRPLRQLCFMMVVAMMARDVVRRRFITGMTMAVVPRSR